MSNATETLTIERLVRTACQVALLPDDAPGNEDAGLASVQALLTPAARVQLALDALAGAGFRGSVALWTDDPARLALLPLRDPPQLRLEDSPPRVVEVARAVPVTSGAPLHITISCFRPATLEDARRVLEGQG